MNIHSKISYHFIKYSKKISKKINKEQSLLTDKMSHYIAALKDKKISKISVARILQLFQRLISP